MVEFTDTSLQLKSIITAHNQWLSKIRSIPYWITVTSHPLWRITAHTLNSFLTYKSRLLPDECSRFTNEFSFITSRRPEYRSSPRTFNCPSVCCGENLCLATCYLATTRSLLLVAARTWLPTRCSAMDVCSRSTIPAFKRCLLNRFLAMDYSVTIYEYVYMYNLPYVSVLVPVAVESACKSKESFDISVYIYHYFCTRGTADTKWSGRPHTHTHTHSFSVSLRIRERFLAELLLSNGCCTVAYFVVVAEQRVFSHNMMTGMRTF
jgi:hypothetical protein